MISRSSITLLHEIGRRFIRWRRHNTISYQKHVMILGDSNSSLPDSRNCWPAILQKMMGRDIHIFNESVPGRTTGFDKNNLNMCSMLNRTLTRYSALDYIFIMLGTNDVKMCYGPPSSSEIAEKMNEIAARVAARHQNTRIVFMVPPPIGKVPCGDFKYADERIRGVCAVISKVCERWEFHVIDIHSILDIHRHLEADAVHINARGREAVAGAVYNYMMKDLYVDQKSD